MKILRPYGARLLVALLLTLAAYNANASSGSEAGAIRTLRVPGVGGFSSVTYENGLFVAVGGEGAIFTSSDGARWTKRNSGTDKSLSDVAYGNGIFVAVGGSIYPNSSTILTSRDGVTWTRRISPTRNLLWSVTYGNGLFVAVGDKGTILTSPDGVNWTLRPSPTEGDLEGVA